AHVPLDVRLGHPAVDQFENFVLLLLRQDRWPTEYVPPLPGLDMAAPSAVALNFPFGRRRGFQDAVREFPGAFYLHIAIEHMQGSADVQDLIDNFAESSGIVPKAAEIGDDQDIAFFQAAFDAGRWR